MPTTSRWAGWTSSSPPKRSARAFLAGSQEVLSLPRRASASRVLLCLAERRSHRRSHGYGLGRMSAHKEEHKWRLCDVGLPRIKTWSSTQSGVSLSSGEAEFNGVARGAGVGLGYQGLPNDLGVDLLSVWTGSSAVIGISTRQGLGTSGHLDTHTHTRCGSSRP